MKTLKNLFQVVWAMSLVSLSTSCCPSLQESAPDSKYLSDFHSTYVKPQQNDIHILNNDMSLYVDYSTCITLGQHSNFFQKLIPSFVSATKHYYSIKGPEIIEEQNVNVFHALSNIVEVNYADLKKAANMIVNGSSEGVLLTDGEYYQANISGGGISDPYMTEAFKIWLRKGHDIYILAEPYIEKHKNIDYNKKRLYFLFTDSRLEGNIYDRIIKTANLEDFPDVELFHLSASHPLVMAENGKLKVNETLSSTTKQLGNYEIQDWPVSWESIEGYIMGASDATSGEPLEFGECVIGGLKVDRNSYGGFRISDVSIKTYDINSDYFNYYSEKENPTGIDLSKISWTETPDLFVYDQKEFKKHGTINIHFNVPMWYPGFLTASPFNYTMIKIDVANVENIFNNYETMFNFDAIGLPGKYNTSISESVKQALFDPEIQRMMKSANLYTIYIKSPEYDN